MTHGCLFIRVKDEERKVVLHTYHTAQDTPLWVKEAPARFALHRGDFLLRGHKTIRSRIDLKDSFTRYVDRGQFEYAPSVAALIIATRPDCYEPVPPGFVKDMAKWSGYGDPYVLTVAGDKWVLNCGNSGKTITIQPVKIAVDALWNKLKTR